MRNIKWRFSYMTVEPLGAMHLISVTGQTAHELLAEFQLFLDAKCKTAPPENATDFMKKMWPNYFGKQINNLEFFEEEEELLENKAECLSKEAQISANEYERCCIESGNLCE
jgi:hypothetical protein